MCAPSRPTACCSKPTCLPESAARYDAADVETPLRATLAELAALRAEDPEALGARIALTSERVLQA